MFFPDFFFFDSRTSGLICVLGMWYCGSKGIKEKSPFTKRSAEGDLDSTLVQFGIHAEVLAPTVRIQPLGTRICHRNGLSFARRSGRWIKIRHVSWLLSIGQCHVYVTWGKTSCKLCSTFLVWGLRILMSWHEPGVPTIGVWSQILPKLVVFSTGNQWSGVLLQETPMYYNYNCWEQRHHRGLVVGKLLWQMLLPHFLDRMMQSR